MTTQQLFYTTVVPVTAERHKDWFIRPFSDYSFASKANSVPLMTAEFLSACSDFPIVFAGDEEAVMPVLLLGMHGGENLFLGEDGSWEGRYLPAFIRRYPFIFSQSEDKEKFFLCIDESFPGFNQAGEGHALIGEDNNPTEFIEGILKFLGNYQQEAQRTQAFCQRLKELNLLERKNVEATMPDGEKLMLAGVYLVDRPRLNSLPSEAIVELVRSGAYELICQHLVSQRSFNLLLDRTVQHHQEQEVSGNSEQPETTWPAS